MLRMLSVACLTLHLVGCRAGLGDAFYSTAQAQCDQHEKAHGYYRTEFMGLFVTSSRLLPALKDHRQTRLVYAQVPGYLDVNHLIFLRYMDQLDLNIETISAEIGQSFDARRRQVGILAFFESMKSDEFCEGLALILAQHDVPNY